MNFESNCNITAKSFKRILTVIMIICMTVIFSFPYTAYGDTEISDRGVVISEDGAFMRAEAAADGSIIETLPDNTEVEILGTVEDPDGNLWYEINYEGETGFVSSELIELNEPVDDADSYDDTAEEVLADETGEIPETEEIDETQPTETNEEITEEATDEITEEASEEATDEITEEPPEELSEEDTDADNDDAEETPLDAKITLKTKAASTLSTTSTSASYPYYGTVKYSEGVNVRSAADIKSSIIVLLEKNTTVTITGSKKDSNGTVWYSINYLDVSGYIRSDLLTKNQIKSTPAVGYVTNKGGANIRSGAGSSYSLVKSVQKGAFVNITGKKVNSSGYTWWSVNYAGNTGYISADLLTVFETGPLPALGKVNDGDTNMRADAGTSSSVVTILKENDIFTVSGSKKGTDGYVWFRIVFSGKTGYIRSDLMDIVKKISTPMVASVTNSGGANMRADAGASNSKVTGLSKGAVVIVNGIKNGNDGYFWFKVSYGKTSGYIRSDLITLSEKISTPALGVVNNNGGINVRSDAGASGSIVTTTSNGDVVAIIGNKKGSDGYIWCQVAYAGCKGYVRSDLITIGKTMPLPAVANIANSGGANMRTDAGASNTKVIDLSKGCIVTVTGIKDGNDGYYWCKVSYGENKGYIRSDLLKINKNLKSKAFCYVSSESGANLRSGAGTSYSVVTGLAADTIAEVKGSKVNSSGYMWYEITSAGKKGYVSADLLAISEFMPLPATGVVTNSGGAYIRAAASSSSSIVTSVSKNTLVTVKGSTRGSDGNLWYSVNLSGKSGYIYNSLISVKKSYSSSNTAAMSDSEFEAYLKEQGFPTSYITYLKALHKKHPSWDFKASITGLNFSDVISKESAPGVNVVASSLPVYYRSKAAGDYDSSTGQYISHDSGGWYTATPEVIKYYMDPRNFLDETGIFQFMTHAFDASTQNKENLKYLVKGTFLDASYKQVSGEKTNFATYSDAIYLAGKNSGVNPYVIASMIIVEQGANGQGASISGTQKGYEGIFNYFNINAYKTSSYSAVENGLRYAKASGNYGRPWNTRYKSILGGARIYYDEYVSTKQNNLYFKKFNVQNGLSSVATHQYMSNVQGAALEASRLKEGYEGFETSISFVIPVYKNMPSSACSLPKDPNSSSTGCTGTVLPADGVNVRSSASTSSPVVTALNYGTVVTVTGSKKGSDGYTWYAISYGGVKGYIRSDLLKISGKVPS